MGDSRIIFKKPSEDIETISSSVLEEREAPVDDGATSTIAVHNPYLTMSIQRQRNMLPIAKHKNQVLYAVERYRAVIIVGETGCGKSTQVPQFLMEAGWCDDKRIIGITQPRRVAAVTLAQRVADEQLCRLGSKVGFVVRFGGVVSEDTVIQYMTDGILLREMSADPLLLKYSVIIIDEAHERSNCDKMWVVPMYGGLNQKEQMKAFDSTPFGTRKIVVATNIAETSVTIPGISFVVDSGFVKMKIMDPRNGIESLMVVPISQAAADQRAGRAGRIKSGKCLRLYTESEFKKLFTSTVPEIQKTNLAPVILQLKSLGIQNVVKFNFLSRPKVESMKNGLELLHALGAIDDEGNLTNPIGTQMCFFPLPPMHSKVLISSEKFGCSEEISTILSMMQIQEVFESSKNLKSEAEFKKREFSVTEGDHITMLNIFNSFLENRKSQKWCNQNFLNYKGLQRAENIKNQITSYMKKSKIKIISCKGLIGETEKIRRCLLSGFFTNVAKYGHDGNFHTIFESTSFKIYRGSSMMYRKEMPKWVFFTDVLQNSIRDVSEIDPEWIKEVAPNFYDYGTQNEISSGIRMEIDHDNIADLN
ncbi:hypothetical protein FO519_004616 [Halicephalobus sp. NKZ332]|nr:hypothetical protein FO519_004616 [Halicephalobus sp. NKZ332]